MSDYRRLSREKLERRLALAEDACVMFGWSPAHCETDREKAAYMLWSQWTDELERQGGSLDPDRWPHLGEERVQDLARERDEIRRQTLAMIKEVI